MSTTAQSTRSVFIEELFAIVREESTRDPFFDAMRAGQVSREGIKTWALQALQVVREFTRFISAIHANCPHREAQQLLAENLWEEHGRGNAERDHFALIKRLARSLGAIDEEIGQTEMLPETSAYIEHCFQVTRNGSFIEGMTAIGVGIERFMPVFFGVLAESLVTHYGLTKTDVEYLLVHVGEDEDHAERSLEIIERYAVTDDVKMKAKQALRDMLHVKRRFADALYARCLNQP